MPLNNLGKTHITATQIADFDKALDDLITIATAITQNLTDEERGRYGSINEKNKLLVNGIMDFHKNQPNLQSSDIDWAEFEADYADRQFADTRADKIQSLMRLITDFKIVHDYDNYHDALTDYDYTKYKAGTNTPGFSEKQNYLKQFFPNTGNTTPPAE